MRTDDHISGSQNGSFRKKQKHTLLQSSCVASAIIPASVESLLSLKLRMQVLYSKDGSYFHVSLSNPEMKNIHHSKHSYYQTSSSISLLSPRFRIQAVSLPVSCVSTCLLNDAQHGVYSFSSWSVYFIVVNVLEIMHRCHHAPLRNFPNTCFPVYWQLSC